MIIGILTYHRSHNFGALLQAIATRNVLTNMGHKVYYIDYWPDYHKAMYSSFSLWAFRQKTLRGKLGYIKKSILRLSINIRLNKKYSSFIRQHIEPYCISCNQEFDAIVYGSDQIWRKQPYINDYNPVYFGDHPYKTQKKVAYAASMGILPPSYDVNSRQKLKGLLANLDYISVREEDLESLVKSLGYKQARLCADPALLLTAKQWNHILGFELETRCINEKYALFVNYIPDSFIEKDLRDYAQRNGLKFIKISGSVLGKDTSDALVCLSPLELLNYIINANVVFTSSFHALIFSIIYSRPFYAAFSNNSGRAKSLLTSLELSNHYLEKGNIISDSPHMDRCPKLNNFIQPSLDYLRMALC